MSLFNTKRRWSLAAYLLPEEQAAFVEQIKEAGVWEDVYVHPCIPSDTNGSSPKSHETLVMSRKSAHRLQPYDEIINAHLRGQRVVDVDELLKEILGRVDLRTINAFNFLSGSTFQGPAIRLYFFMKSLLEPVMATVLLILLAPVLMGLALAIYLTSGGPVFYRQERLGYRGRKFALLKFRTMTATAESAGPQWAKEGDTRVTRIGGWLRKTRLDELPQILNVVLGDLSFVGPRPERGEFYRVLNLQIPLFKTRLFVRPGITGWAQVKYGYAASVDESRKKLEYDLYYIQNMSPLMDIKVMLQTLALITRGNSGR